jgi:two-component system, OmpR family, response regulator
MSSEHARVLVCGDEPDLAVHLAKHLEMEGYEVRVCHDGPGAIRTAMKWRPFAAIIDIQLPGTSGYALAQELRELLGSDVLLIALTSYGGAADIELARQVGFHWHFQKPAPSGFIVEVLRDPNRKPVARQDGVPLNPYS